MINRILIKLLLSCFAFSIAFAGQKEVLTRIGTLATEAFQIIESISIEDSTLKRGEKKASLHRILDEIIELRRQIDKSTPVGKELLAQSWTLIGINIDSLFEVKEGAPKSDKIEAGVTLIGEKNNRYRIIKKLGAGDFGEVWQAENLTDGTLLALKIYFDEHRAQIHSRRIKEISQALETRPPPNVIHIHAPQTMTILGAKKLFTVIPSELAEASVEALAPSEFRLASDLSEAERSRRITNASKLLIDLLAASRQLNDRDFVHHDLNPRNILRANGAYKVADLDGMTSLEEAPPDGSWEVSYAAIEYLAKGDIRKTLSGQLSDLSTVGNTVFFALFGENPIELYLQQVKGDKKGGNNYYDKLWNLRDELRTNKNSALSLQKLVRDKFAQAFEDGLVPVSALKEFSFLSKIISAATIIDPGERRQQLASALSAQVLVKDCENVLPLIK